MEKKKQHLIPKCYLEAWCDPATPDGQTPYVWAFTKDGLAARRKAPKKIFTETDPYTITGPNGERDLRLEDGLSNLESQFVKVRQEKIEKEIPLDESDGDTLLLFAAAMLARTESQREHQRKQWGRVLDTAEKISEAAKTGSVPVDLAPDDGPKITMAEVQRIVTAPLQETLAPTMSVVYKLFKTLDMALFKTTTELGFITSDTPCVSGASELDRRPATFFDSVLHLPSTEVYLPLSPRFCLILTRAGLTGSISIPDALLDEINRRVRFGSLRTFIVNQNLKRDYWFAEIPRDFNEP